MPFEIASASDEQADAIALVNTGIDQVAQVVQQNSATAEESAAASEEMSGQSGILSQLISRFKLKDMDSYSPPSSDAKLREGTSIILWETAIALSGNSGTGYGKY